MKPSSNEEAAARDAREVEAPAARPGRRSRLRIEITIALCVKLLLLLLLREVWFSHPQSKGLTERGVAAALVGAVNDPLPGEERANGSRP